MLQLGRIISYNMNMPRDAQRGFKGFRLLHSFKAAASGFGQTIRTEQNLRIHLVVMLLVLAAGIWLRLESVEWLLVIVCVGAVISAELLNTALEYLCDVVRDEMKLNYKVTKHPRDMAAAAVLMTSIMAAGVGVAIFGPKVWDLFFG